MVKRLILLSILFLNLTYTMSRAMPYAYLDMLVDSIISQHTADEPATFNYIFTFPQGESELLRGFNTNTAELDKLDSFIQTLKTDSTIVVKRVLLTGYCSIEGKYAVNEKLARKRVHGLYDYLDQKYHLSSTYKIDVNYVPEDWDKLRELVSASSLKEKNEILRIIDTVPIFKGREKALMDLNRGVPYKKLAKDYFHLLRRSEMIIECEIQRPVEKPGGPTYTQQEVDEMLKKEREVLVTPEKEQVIVTEVVKTDTVWITESNAESNKEIIKRWYRSLKPVIGLRTNLVTLAGVTPEFEHKTFMPNLAAEWFFDPKWSVMASGTYAYWNYGSHDEFWGVSAYSLEPRFWLNDDARHHGLYFGAFGLFGDFDIQQREKQDADYVMANYTGKYWQAGVSAGYHLRLSRYWGMEIGVRAGYQHAKPKVYEMDGSDKVYQYTIRDKRWGLMDLIFSLTYRFGKSEY